MNVNLTEEQEKLALQYEPFEGDDTDVRGLQDKFVVGRKQHECFHCRDVIEVGERHRAKTERNNEEHKIMTFRFCSACCETFALFEKDYNDKPMMERYNQGRAIDNARHVIERPDCGCYLHKCDKCHGKGFIEHNAVVEGGPTCDKCQGSGKRT